MATVEVAGVVKFFNVVDHHAQCLMNALRQVNKAAAYSLSTYGHLSTTAGLESTLFVEGRAHSLMQIIQNGGRTPVIHVDRLGHARSLNLKADKPTLLLLDNRIFGKLGHALALIPTADPPVNAREWVRTPDYFLNIEGYGYGARQANTGQMTVCHTAYHANRRAWLRP